MQAESLGEHFKQYFSLHRANTQALKDIVYKIRYDVYCAELKYEQNCPKDCEKDMFDEYSYHILIKHLSSGRFAGCVRLVTPPKSDHSALLPFEDCCLQSVDPDKIQSIEQDGKNFIGEISRLAVHHDFRRRPGENSNPYGVDIEHPPLIISPHEQRIFPFISVSLYLASAAIALHYGLKYVVVMMEPRLARLLNRFGIRFSQLGDEMSYHGTRAMFYIDKKMLFDNLKPELKELFQFVSEEIKSK